MAILDFYVDPDAVGDGDGGGDGAADDPTDEDNWTDAYTSFSAFEAAQQQDLVGGGNQMHCWFRASGGAADTTAVIINTWTTGAANYIQIETAPGDEADADGWDVTKYRLSVADSIVLILNENVIRINKLQIEKTSSDDDGQACISTSGQTGGTSDIRIERCRFRQAGNVNFREQSIINADPDLVIQIFNCIFEGIGALNSSSNSHILMTNCTTADVYNCTLYGSGNAGNQSGMKRSGGVMTAANCAVFKNGDDFNGTITKTKCASDDNDAENVAESGGGVEWPDDFVDAANGDFTLKVGSNLIGGGDDNPEGGTLYSDDINGDARTSIWDVGADEFVVVAAGGPAPISLMHRKIMKSLLTR